jgi:5-enolpyruvylshikimate-3-phosphate synthase
VSSKEGVELEGSEAVDVSFPGFFRLLEQLTPPAE